MKPAFAGFLAGVALVTAFAIARHRSASVTPASELAASVPAPAETAAAPGTVDLAALRDRAASLRSENAQLAASLQELATTAAGGSAAKQGRRSRRELGADLLRVFGPDGASNNALYTRVRMELALLAGDSADKEGVTTPEGRLSPQMLEAVLMGMREACVEEISTTEAGVDT